MSTTSSLVSRLAVVAAPALLAIPSSVHAQADAWWRHITVLADDSMRGRQTGSPEERKAAAYVVAELARAGAQPLGVGGWYQPVRFRSRRIDESKSSLTLLRGRNQTPVTLGDEATFNMRVLHALRVEAPLTFIGYGLSMPEAGHDDLKNANVRGKVVVLLAGGPPSVPSALLAHHQRSRWDALRAAGAVGVIQISNPRAMDVPWERSMLARLAPQMALTDTLMSDTRGQQLAVTWNPARAEKLFAGSGHTFAEVIALANDGKPLPHFALPSRVRAAVETQVADVQSQNVVGVLPGSDPAVANQYVVLSAHLDHTGVGQPVAGDSIFNGAMDNASGIATLLETAKALGAGKRPRRSVILLAVTAEEKGLLGSRYFAAHPTVRRASIVANINTDMPLPLFPLRSVIAQGLDESDLGADLRAVAEPLGLRVLPDPEPLRNAFTRSDQYNFVLQGVPAISLRVGFDAESPEHEIVKRWRTERYHAVGDDLTQPVNRQAAADFNAVVVRLVETVANRDARPAWNAESFFKRYAK